MKKSSKTTGKGFTLIELLVAMAITTIIITILVSITGLSLDTWNRSRSEIRASRQAKAMIDSMSRDLESLVVRKGNNFEWLYAKFNPPGDSPKDQYESPSAADFVFFTAATDRYDGNIGPDFPNSKGDVSTVVYQLTYKDPIGGGSNDKFKTFVLYRKLINPDVTFGVTPDPGILGTQFTESGNGLLTTAQNAGAAVDDDTNFICENVYQFNLTFHVEVAKPDGSLITVPVQLGAVGEDKATNLFKVGGSGLHMDDINRTYSNLSKAELNKALKVGRLTSVEISLSVITDFGLRQMQSPRDIDENDLDEFIAENTYQYSKLVPVPGS